MNCFIILLLLFCCGNSNGVCGDKDHHEHKHSCGCRENNNDNSCKWNDKCDNDCAEERCDRCNDDRREDRREERREKRYFDDGTGMRNAPWQDYSNYNRNDSYNRNETCGCEEN